MTVDPTFQMILAAVGAATAFTVLAPAEYKSEPPPSYNEARRYEACADDPNCLTALRDGSLDNCSRNFVTYAAKMKGGGELTANEVACVHLVGEREVMLYAEMAE